MASSLFYAGELFTSQYTAVRLIQSCSNLLRSAIVTPFSLNLTFDYLGVRSVDHVLTTSLSVQLVQKLITLEDEFLILNHLLD
jgi:hypothetical protein